MENMEGIVRQLEQAANIVLAPPNVVSNQERLHAQSVVQAFKDQRYDMLPICNLILDKSRNELVLHETAQVLRKTLQLRWADLPVTEIDTLCQKLVTFIFHSPGLSYGIHRSLATVVALIVKRDRVLRQGKKCVELVQFLESLMHGATLAPTCAILDALMSEHQFVANNDDLALSFDMHTLAKRDFEIASFLRIFQLCLGFLNSFNNDASADTQANSKALGMILDLLENVFSWNFAALTLTKRLAAIIERDTAARWKPPVQWKETILNASCFQIIFQTYQKLRFNETFLSKLVTIIVQYTSVYGPVLHSEGYYGSPGSSSLDFLNQLLPHLIATLELQNKSPNEVLGLSDIIRKLVIFHRPAVLMTTTDGLFEKYLNAAAAFSYFIIQQGVTEEANCSIEDRMFRDATTRVLDMWTMTISDVDAVPRETLEPIAKNLFNFYLLGRLSPPEGTRAPSNDATEEVVDDEEQSDETQFRDQLEVIGFIGRYVISHSVPFMNNLLAFKIQAFQRLIEQGAAAQGPAGKESLIALYEDLHWTILVAGELISFEALGEICLIPPELNQLSVEAAASPTTSNAALQSALQLQPIAEAGVDPVMRLVYQVIALLEMEARLIESNLGFLLSPIVAQNILWFLNRWASIYFIFSEDRYASISEAFSSGWGEGSPVVAEIQTLLFHRIRMHLVSFVGEDGVTGEAINLIDSLVATQKKAKLAMASPALTPLIDLLNQVGANSQQSPMSNLRYQKFVGALTEIGTHCASPEERRAYFARVIGPILTRFQNLSQVINDKHRDDVRQELVSIFNGLIGVSLSSQSKCASEIFTTLSVAAKQCGPILSTFSNYNDIVDLCLEFITQLAKQSLSYLPKAESYCLYECAMSVVKAYAQHATGRHSREQTAEEESYNDLMMVMEMLFCLLTKDLLDFSSVFRLVEALSGGGNNVDTSEPQIHASDVCLQGLAIILPLMSADLIQYPSLSSKYFKLLAYVSELHAEKVLEVQPWMLEAIFRSIELGLQKSVPDDFSCCCEFIANVASQLGKTQQTQAHAQVQALINPFLKIFLQMLLSNGVGKDYMAPFSTALFALISLFQDLFNELAQELIRSCSSDSKRLVLEDGFKKLTENLNLRNGGDRVSRAGFRDRLEAFVFSVSGSLN